jgi:chorismate synthase
MNTLGSRLRVHLFGESHGAGVGCIVEGVPPGTRIDTAAMQTRLDQRRPGTSHLVSARNEPDRLVIQSGTYNERATGAPVTLWIANNDARSQDYKSIHHRPRPGHADWPAHQWAKGFEDPRGGGPYSGRLTAPLVAAAALVAPMLEEANLLAAAYLQQVGDVEARIESDAAAVQARVAASPVHAADPDAEAAFVSAIEAARTERDSIGGCVGFVTSPMPVGWGDPFFDGIESQWARALFAIPAVKGVEFGAGFAAATMLGSAHNDAYRPSPGGLEPVTNHAGGALGGRTSGAPIWGRVAIKPASSIAQSQMTVDLDTGKSVAIETKGRHDPCIAVRAVPVVRAVAELCLADMLLLARHERSS